ncbi:MAG TPA: hypothetical protein VFE15_13665 [Marmoricola sp.]|jgi:hypothetical protein|nr:hypothetical protein [Marmoricola sp.]
MQLEDNGPEDQEPELIEPEDFLPPAMLNPFPADAQRMGMDRYTGSDAAMLAFASNLDSKKPSHRLFAMLLLIVVVGSFAYTLWGQMH